MFVVSVPLSKDRSRAPLDGAIGSEILPNLNFRFTGWRPQSNLWSLQKIKNILTFDFMYTWNLVLKVGQSQIRIEFKFKKIIHFFSIEENVSNSLFSNVLRFLIRVRDKFHCFLKSSYRISFLNVKIMDKLFYAFTMPRSSVTFSYVECTCFDSIHKS